MLCGDLDGKEIQKRGDVCVHTADSLCCTAETHITLYSNYTPPPPPILIKKKKKDDLRGYSGRVICTGKQGKPGQVTFFCVIAALSRAPGAHRITPSHSFSISKRGWGEVLGLRQTKSTRSLGVSQRNAKSKPTQRGEGPSVFLVYSPQG